MLTCLDGDFKANHSSLMHAFLQRRALSEIHRVRPRLFRVYSLIEYLRRVLKRCTSVLRVQVLQNVVYHFF
jgi:hypothetical protein